LTISVVLFHFTCTVCLLGPHASRILTIPGLWLSSRPRIFRENFYQPPI
jgi:hypothetical protein